MSSATLSQAKAALLKAHSDRLKELHPDWSFVRCWQTAQAGHPELSEEYTTASATEPVYRYVETPHDVVRVQKPLRELLADFGETPIRIEA